MVSFFLIFWLEGCLGTRNASRRAEEKLNSKKRQWLSLGQPWALERAVLTTCGAGAAADNNGWWKPSTMMDGVITMAESLRETGSRVPVLFVSFASERTAHAQCRASSRLSRAEVTCFELDETVSRPSGYGYSKIAAVIAAPVRVALWIDADAYFAASPDSLFDDASPALFWPDFYGHFSPTWQLWNIVGLDKRDAWDWTQGFDSGLFVIDKQRTSRVLHRVDSMARGLDDDDWRWARLSHGDKDLWHLALMLEGTPFTLSPYAAVVTWRRKSDAPFHLVAQAKCNAARRVVVLHQNWHAINESDQTALFVVDLRRLHKVPWTPDIKQGLDLPHDPPRFARIQPAPRRLVAVLNTARASWFPTWHLDDTVPSRR